MSIALAVEKYSPAVNPDRVLLKATFSGNYVTGGDTLNLTPDTWADPNGIGILGFPQNPPTVPPSVFQSSLLDSSSDLATVRVVPGASLAAYTLEAFDHTGAQLAAGAYPAGFTGNSCYIEVLF